MTAGFSSVRGSTLAGFYAGIDSFCVG